MKKKIILYLALCTAALGARAQNNDNKDHGWFGRNVAGAAQLQFTYRPSQFDGLNSILNKNGIPSLPGNNSWLNLSMSHLHKKWLFEDGVGATFMSSSAANATNGIKAKFNQYQFYTRAGYNVSTNSNMRVFPFVGLNLSAARLHIQDDNRMESTSDFSTELLNTTASKNLWDANLGFEFGGGFDYVIKLKPKQMDCYTIERNIPIGVRIGYYLQATNTKWNLEDTNHPLNNGPGDKQSAVFVSFNIGLGYSVKK